jgi:hypothetical protein
VTVGRDSGFPGAGGGLFFAGCGAAFCFCHASITPLKMFGLERLLRVRLGPFWLGLFYPISGAEFHPSAVEFLILSCGIFDSRIPELGMARWYRRRNRRSGGFRVR